MIKNIQNNFSGMLDLQGIGNGKCDAFFNVQNNIVTIIPLTNECKRHAHILSYNDGSNEKINWLYGFSEDSCSIAFLQKTHLHPSISAPIDMGTSRFRTPIIVKSSTPNGIDLRTFNSIEFRGGIIDVLHSPDLLIDITDAVINFKDFHSFTKTYEVEINKEKFEIMYSIDTDDLMLETGKVPDLRKSIHSIVRFNFDTDKPLCDIEKYYSYALSFFQFCTGRLNVNFEIRLYKTKLSENQKKVTSSPILVKLQDGFDDYANETLTIMSVIRFQLLGDKLPLLFKILNEEDTHPYLSFLIKRNKNIGNVLYTDIGDICVALEREFSFINANRNQENQKYAKKLTEELLDIINKKCDCVCPEAVKKKASNILNSQLKNFSPSLKEKINTLYDEFEPYIKSITEQENHDLYGITKFYSNKEFKKKISQFVDIRNKASHVGIIWNDGVEIFIHLKLLIYFCILKRTGYSMEECSCVLSYLFGRYF